MRIIGLLLASVGLIVGCATPGEPAPPIAGDLTRREIETAISDAMLVTAAHLFRLLADDHVDEPDGEILSESSVFTWTDADMRNSVGTVRLELNRYRLRSDLFGDNYRDYQFSGVVEMDLNGDAADLSMDLTCEHSQPDRYPVTSLEMELTNLEDTIRPENVSGYIRANGHDVDVPTVVRALQVGD